MKQIKYKVKIGNQGSIHIENTPFDVDEEVEVVITSGKKDMNNDPAYGMAEGYKELAAEHEMLCDEFGGNDEIIQ